MSADDDTLYVHDDDGRLVGMVRWAAYGSDNWMVWARDVHAPDGWGYVGAYTTRERALSEFGVA